MSGRTVDLPLDRLAVHLETHGMPTRGLTAQPIGGGRSNLTYLLSADTSQGRSQWVLRRPPLGHVLATAHDMAREYRVISALNGSDVPVPDAILACGDPDVIGAPFFLMEYAEGQIVRTSQDLVDLGTRGRAAGDSLVDVLVALHAVDPASVGLADFGRPSGFLTRQVRRWTTQLQASRSRELPGLDELAAALAGAIPPQGGSALVHGDYRLDNCILQQGQVLAVLDWEMATVGDPLADVALFAVYSGGFADLPQSVIHSPASIGSFPSTLELLTRYSTAAHRDLGHFGWYLGFAWLKLAVILEGIHYRSLLGMSAGDEFEGVGPAVPHAIERGRAALFDDEWPA